MVLVLLLTVMTVVYALPTIIAIIRQVESFATALILNSFPIACR